MPVACSLAYATTNKNRETLLIILLLVSKHISKLPEGKLIMACCRQNVQNMATVLTQLNIVRHFSTH